jgi:hypothetical protein
MGCQVKLKARINIVLKRTLFRNKGWGKDAASPGPNAIKLIVR